MYDARERQKVVSFIREKELESTEKTIMKNIMGSVDEHNINKTYQIEGLI